MHNRTQVLGTFAFIAALGCVVPFLAGVGDRSPFYIVAWIVMLTAMNILTGWREGGLVRSTLLGLSFVSVFAIPAYLAGLWWR